MPLSSVAGGPAPYALVASSRMLLAVPLETAFGVRIWWAVCCLYLGSRFGFVDAAAVDYRKVEYEMGYEVWLLTGSYSGFG